MKILSVFGTRPEAIKMAPVLRALAAEPGVDSRVCVTGQHRQMIAPLLDFFGVAPDADLGLMRPGQSLNGLVSGALWALDEVLEALRPDRVLVHGDTSTAMAAALAAFHRRIPVGHVEAGLRTYDSGHPFPEEMNRRIVDLASDLMFAPTARSAANLAAEALEGRVLVTGNTVIDTLHWATARLDADHALRAKVDAGLPRISPGHRLVLVTGHRRENFGDGMANICAALLGLSRMDRTQIVYPVHLNPNVQGPVTEALAGQPNIHLIPPQDYVAFLRLMQRADVILTDSGGVQEEAPALGKPVLVMRDTTERPEALASGAVSLVGTDAERILSATLGHLERLDLGGRGPAPVSPYGDGRAAARIVDAVVGREVIPFAPSAPPTLRAA
ncbi:non-hydrolyzing UDP-N-acetylglucosamine 2-epimerase [Phenylobacterium sp.]|jgi:UDP-N-acetylglucosamine 2-epimerase (non-hydrolysing)|uniref:non-hydrolyzing UDP-N-acetylglucosamine 2-epimerase n=1 Tax=Phenylobacterium sp. TaxID=1871053 RepID=UPI002F91F82F